MAWQSLFYGICLVAMARVVIYFLEYFFWTTSKRWVWQAAVRSVQVQSPGRKALPRTLNPAPIYRLPQQLDRRRN